MELDKRLLQKMQQRVEQEMLQREMRMLEYWKGELEKIVSRRHEGLASLELDLKGVIQRMENRIRLLRRESQK
jgi:hypothetical protein